MLLESRPVSEPWCAYFAADRRTDDEEHRDRETMSRSLEAHRAITPAIDDRDCGRAYQLMTQHAHTPPMIEPVPDGDADADAGADQPRRA